MRHDRWRTVARLLKQVQGTVGRLVLAVAPQPLGVVLYEVPLLARTQPPRNPLRGFVQEAVAQLGQPTAADIARLLHLPQVVVELVLGNLMQMGGLSVDAVGRWNVPDGGTIFRLGEDAPPIWRRTRQLLCYWPERKVMLPVLPRLRLRDLVELGVHKIQGEVREWYAQLAALSGPEAERRGLLATFKLLPLCDAATGTSPTQQFITEDAPLPDEEVLVSRCRLDVIALSWATQIEGLWELSSRMWCRPTPPQDSDGEPFAPGEPFVGLSLPEHLLGGGNRLDGLGKLFDSSDDAKWRTLLKASADEVGLERVLQGDHASIILKHPIGHGEHRRSHLLRTTLSPEARLVCTSPEVASSREKSATLR